MITKKYTEIDGIKVFNPEIKEEHEDFHSIGLDNLFKQEEKHFWFIARKEFICKQIKKHIPINKKIIEIGAGTGNVSRYLSKSDYCDISIGEIHMNGLEYAKEYGIKNRLQFDLLDAPFEKEFDVVCMFDVIEHIEDDNLALKNIQKILNKDGQVILTVPSHMWLWNRNDKILGHKTRYTKKLLEKKLEENGFQVLNSRYFFISIVPLLLLRTFINRDSNKPITDDEREKNDLSINPIINCFLLFISRLENKINNFIPNLFGGSLFIIAKKK